MAQALVAAGEGIALLPRLMLRPAHPGVAIRPLAANPPMRGVSALRPSTRYLSPATERFLTLPVAASADHSRTHANPKLRRRHPRDAP
jgi:DNA-binding transcriptional LysR family regulator